MLNDNDDDLHNLFPGRSQQNMAEGLYEQRGWLHDAPADLKLTQLEEMGHHEPEERKARVRHHILTPASTTPIHCG